MSVQVAQLCRALVSLGMLGPMTMENPGVYLRSSGLVVWPTEGCDLFQVASVASQFFPSIRREAPPLFRESRLVINIQHWSEAFQSSEALTGGLAMLANDSSLTIALHWRGSRGPEAREFEPAAEVARQQGLVLVVIESSENDVKEAEFQSLLEQLKDSDWRLRFHAARGLQTLGDRRAVEPLIQAMGDGHSIVRLAAVAALGELGDPRAVEPLIRLLGDSDDRVRQLAVLALGMIGGPQTVEPLAWVLLNGDGKSRVEAASALGSDEYLRAIMSLVRGLRNDDDKSQEALAKFLGVLDYVRAVELLIQALREDAILDQETAAELLSELWDDKRAREAIIDWASRQPAS